MADGHQETSPSDRSAVSHVSQTRRSALKKMLLGTTAAAGAAALPDHWTKPIVDRVLVPAHAQTSQEPTTTQAPRTTTPPTTPAPTTPAPTTTQPCGAEGYIIPVTLEGDFSTDITVTGLDANGNWPGEDDIVFHNHTDTHAIIQDHRMGCSGATAHYRRNLPARASRPAIHAYDHHRYATLRFGR